MNMSDRFFNLMAYCIELGFAFLLFLAPVIPAAFFAVPLWMRNVENDRIIALTVGIVAVVLGLFLARWVWKRENPSSFYGRLQQGFQKGTSDDVQ